MNEQIKDGGPAFPCEQHETQDNMWNQTFESGMTLRDYFAAKAMQALLTQGGVSVQKHVAEGTLVLPAREGIPLLSYEYADAMLAAREAKS